MTGKSYNSHRAELDGRKEICELETHRKADPLSELSTRKGKGDNLEKHHIKEPEDYKACSQLNHG